MSELLNGLLGHNRDKELLFLDDHEFQEYKKNLLSQPYNWEYRNKEIIYKYNSYGHRCVQIDELSNDYILYSGCSFTEGLSLKIEDSYVSILSNYLNKQYYNLGLGGSGPSICARNIMSFLTIKKEHPKLIVIQWPNFYRFYKVLAVDTYVIQEYNVHNQADNDLLYKGLLQEDNVFYYNNFERIYLLAFLYNIGYAGQLIEMFGESHSEIETITEHDLRSKFTNKKHIQLPCGIDYARDLGHPGTKTNKLYADTLLEILK